MRGESEHRLATKARSMPKSLRKSILRDFPETELHDWLEDLLGVMEPSASVARTHGNRELGKDLVLVKQDALEERVIAVVVHRGKISGKTKGDIDKIISQVRQAFAHPAEIPDREEELDVTRVWVFLIGTMSAGARVRLRRELGGTFRAVGIFNIDKITDLFSENLPSVFFRSHVFDVIDDLVTDLETQHDFCGTGKTLSECFEPPMLQRPSSTKLSRTDSRPFVRRQKPVKHSAISDSLKPGHRIAVLGAPGSGKSVLLSKLTLDMFHQESERSLKSRESLTQIPVLVKALSIREVASAAGLLERVLPANLPPDTGVSALMVDGLDELAWDERAPTVERLAAWTDELGAPLVISARTSEAARGLLVDFDTFEIEPFSIGQAVRLFTRLVQQQKHLANLRESIARFQEKIPMTPLSLSLLIRLVEDLGEIPASIAELFDRFADLIVGRYDKDRGIQVIFEYWLKRQFLAAVAFEALLDHGRTQLSGDEFAGFVRDFATKYGLAEEQLDTFLREIERAGVLACGEQVAFVDRSFFEFFAATYLSQKRDEIEDVDTLVADLYFSNTASEVAVFYVGLKRELPERTLDAVLTGPRDEPYAAADRFMVGRLLQAAWGTPAALKERGMLEGIVLGHWIRETLVDEARQLPRGFPLIHCDFLVLSLAKAAYDSMFLADPGLRVLKELRASEEPHVLYDCVLLLYSIARHLDPGQLEAQIQELYESLSLCDSVAFDEKASAFLLLRMISEGHRSLSRTIEKRIQRLVKSSPETFRALLRKRKT